MLTAKLPLLDTDINPEPLLEAVARKRERQAWLLGHVSEDPKAYLDPEQAHQLFNEVYGGAPQMDPYTQNAYEPTGALKQTIMDARSALNTNFPDWGFFQKLPVKVLISPQPSILSYSCFLHPQHIYLGMQSFGGSNADLLLESYLHEYAHVWLYLIQEISPFSNDRYGYRYTLPSGTSNRTVTATIDAAFVAAALRKYYAKLGNANRRCELTAYLAGCLMQIRNDPDLTPIGLSVCRRLAQEVASASPTSAGSGRTPDDDLRSHPQPVTSLPVPESVRGRSEEG